MKGGGACGVMMSVEVRCLPLCYYCGIGQECWSLMPVSALAGGSADCGHRTYKTQLIRFTLGTTSQPLAHMYALLCICVVCLCVSYRASQSPLIPLLQDMT